MRAAHRPHRVRQRLQKSETKKRDKEQVQTKLDLATAFSHLGQGNYEKVASYIFRLGPPKDLGDWTGKVSRPDDQSLAKLRY